MVNYNIELSQLARNVSVADTTQFVGIGTTLPDAKLHIGPNENSDIALQADGNVRVGFSSTTNYIAFHGTYLDGSLDPGVNEAAFHLYTHSFIAERVYDDIYRNANPNPNPNLRVGQKSELLLFKGNDPYPFTGADREPGADRIRLAGAEIHIDTYSHPIPSSDLRTVEDAATHDNLYQRLVVTGPGDVGIGTTLPTARVHIAKNTTPGADISTVGDIALQADGNVRVGFSTTSNYIAFHGTWWDGVSSPGVQQVSSRVPYTHTYVGERIYNYPEDSELLLYKGNDNHSAFGNDRIRYLSGTHEFQLIFDDDTVGTFEEVGNFAGVTTALVIDGIGETGVTTTTVFGNFAVNGNVESDLTVSTGNSITGSGIGLTGTIDAPDGIYGSSTAALQITVADGRISNVSTDAMTTGVSNIAEVIVRNNDITVGTAGTINFGSNLTASPVSDGISTISVSGSLFSYDQASNQLQQSTGTNVTLPLAGTGNNQDGLLSHEDKSKLNGIELGATADQSASEIKAAYESNADTNVFTDSEKAKLNGIETGATADQTASEIKTAYESNADTNVFTDSEKSKLSGIAEGAGVFAATNLSYNNSTRVLDSSTGNGVTLPLASNSNDGLLSSSDKSKLDGIEPGAEVNVQADWNATSGDAFIQNKPTIPTDNNQLANGAGYVTANTQLSNEQVQDIVGGMVTGNTESGISVTYQDSDGTLDFSVASQTDNNFTSPLKTKLDNIQVGAQVNVQANWTATSGDAFIQNKPTLGTAAATNSTDYATAAQGALADTSSQVISTNTTFYVSNSVGNDNNDGLSSNSQWETIQKAADYLSARRLKSGVQCTVLIAAGTYTSTSPLNLEHPQGDSITYIGATPSGTKPVGTALKGSSGSAIIGYTSASQLYNNGLLQAYYNTVLQFNSSSGVVVSPTGAVKLKNILFRGNYVDGGVGNTYNAIKMNRGGSVSLDNCAIHNFGNTGIYLVFGGNIKLNNVTITNCKGGILNTSGTILGDLSDSSLGAQSQPPLTISNCAGEGLVTLRNSAERINFCMISNNGGRGIEARESSSTRAEKCIIDNNSQEGVSAENSASVLIRNSTVTNNGFNANGNGRAKIPLRATISSTIDFRETGNNSTTFSGNATAPSPPFGVIGNSGGLIQV